MLTEVTVLYGAINFVLHAGEFENVPRLVDVHGAAGGVVQFEQVPKEFILHHSPILLLLPFRVKRLQHILL